MTEIEAMGYTTEDAEKVDEIILDLAIKTGMAAYEVANAVYKVLRVLPIKEVRLNNENDHRRRRIIR